MMSFQWHHCYYVTKKKIIKLTSQDFFNFGPLIKISGYANVSLYGHCSEQLLLVQ